MENQSIITLAADVVSAYVSNNRVGNSEIAGLIVSVYAALDSAGKPAPVAEAKKEPAVSIRSSVKPDAITCLECGKKMKLLKRHLTTDHSLTPAEYRLRWNLAADYPIVAPNYAETRKRLAIQIGLGRRPGARRIPRRIVSSAAQG